MASNLTAYTPIPDGTRSTPSVINSRLSQLDLNTISANSLTLDIQSGTESIATGAIGSAQIADRAITGVKLATSAVTTRALGTGSVTSLTIADSGVRGSNLSVGGSEVTARRFIATATGFAAVGGNLGTLATLAEDSLVWKSTYVLGPGSGTSTGFNLGGTGTTTGAYESNTSLTAVRCFSDNTEYFQAHSAGLVVSNSSAPSGGKGSGVKGDIRWASGFIYVCSSTSSWERAALSRF